MTIDQIADMLEQLHEQGADKTVNLIPDSNEPVTDEDSENEEDTGGRGMDINHLGRVILSQQGEVNVYDDDDRLPDLTVYNAEGDSVQVVQDETEEDDGEEDREVEEEARPSSSKKRRVEEVPQLSRKKNKDREWYEEKLERYGQKIPAFLPVPARSTVPNDCVLPYQFLRLYLTPDFIEMLSVKSMLYCVKKGAPEKQATMTSDSILTSIGVMYLTGYLNPAQRHLYWEDRLDTQNLFVKNAISRNKFRDVLRYTYFTGANDVNPDDAFWKVRPLFTHINTMARELIEQPEWVCIDESMIRYFGPHPLKQCIREKPER